MEWAIVNQKRRVLDDHGTLLVFPNKLGATRYLRPYRRAHLVQQHRRAWLTRYRERRRTIFETAIAETLGEEIKAPASRSR